MTVESECGDVSKPPKKRVAIIMGYIGTNYKGMQINPGVISIEEVLFRSLCDCGYVSEANKCDPKKVSLGRSCRTDKGVHAVMQVVSIKLLLCDSLREMVDKINARLPEDIRVFDVRITCRSFNPKILCNSRKYEYFIPTYMLQRLTGEELEGIRKGNVPSDTDIKGYRVDDISLSRLDRILSLFQGTHCFHNYTIGVPYNDKSSVRYIKAIQRHETFEDDFGTEWIGISIHGASFMLHQIRKMMGMAIIYVKTGAKDSLVERTFTEEKFCIPKSPEFSLFLGEAIFDGYNRSSKCRSEISPKGIEDLLYTFKTEKVCKIIPKIESDTHSFAGWWIHTLQFDNIISHVLAGE